MIRIEEIMKQKKIGITDLAKKMQVNRMTIYYYIKQDEKNSISQLKKIADALDVDLLELFVTKRSDEFTALISNRGDLKQFNSVDELKKYAETL